MKTIYNHSTALRPKTIGCRVLRPRTNFTRLAIYLGVLSFYVWFTLIINTAFATEYVFDNTDCKKFIPLKFDDVKLKIITINNIHYHVVEYIDSIRDYLQQAVIFRTEDNNSENPAIIEDETELLDVIARPNLGMLIVTSKHINILNPNTGELVKFSIQIKKQYKNAEYPLHKVEREDRKSVLQLYNGKVLLAAVDGAYVVDLSFTEKPKKILSSTTIINLQQVTNTNDKPSSTEVLVITSDGTYAIDTQTSISRGPYPTSEHVTAANYGKDQIWLDNNEALFLDHETGSIRKIDTYNPKSLYDMGNFVNTQIGDYYVHDKNGKLSLWRIGSKEAPKESEIIAKQFIDSIDNSFWLYEQKNNNNIGEVHSFTLNEGIVETGLVNGSRPQAIFKGYSGFWVVDDRHIYLWPKKNEPSRVLPGNVTHIIGSQDAWDDSAIRMITAKIDQENGIYIVAPNIDPIFFKTPDLRSRNIKLKQNSAWIPTDKGLYYWSRLKPLELHNVSNINITKENDVFEVFENAEETLVYINDSYYKLDDFILTPITDKSNYGKIKIYQSSSYLKNPPEILEYIISQPDQWVISPYSSALILGRIKTKLGPWDSTIKFNSHIPKNIESGQELVVKWVIENYGCRTDSSIITQSLKVQDEAGQIVYEVSTPEITRINYGQLNGAPDIDYFQVIIPGLKTQGNYNVKVNSEDTYGFPQEKEFTFSVAKSLQDILLSISINSTFGILIASVIAFISLTIGSRWSERCFDILTDPLFRRIGVYFGPAIRYIRPVRLWILERYYQNTKATLFREHAYLTVNLYAGNNTAIESTELISEMKKNNAIWVQGAPGSGKTELILELMREYFSYPTLKKAWEKYHFIPVLIRLRDFSHITISIEDWIPEVTRLSFRSKQFRFDDVAFFRALLTCGDFMLILDGINEVNRTADFQQYLAESGKIKLLVTSQGPAPSTEIRRLIINLLSKSEAISLLKILVASKKVIPENALEILLEDLISGYDVLLLANLIDRDIELPTTKSSLYAETLKISKNEGGETFSEEIVCRAAWELWKTGNRKFIADDKMTEDIISALRIAQVIVVRSGKYEFRHDLMRGYLAARWLVFHSTSFDQIISRLATADLWDLSPSEQSSVFPFVVENFSNTVDLELLLSDALKFPTQRIVLIESIQMAAKKRNVSLTITINQSTNQRMTNDK